ncbi:MAG: Ppx/GppA family phosphatase [Myxococcota bacterium]
MRAVIDIGSNSVLLLIGSRAPDGAVSVEYDDAKITRLARGASATGRLDPDAVRRTVAVLAEYRDVADRLGAEITAVATEGLRVASDPEVFLEPAAAALGSEVRMISGDEEARLSYLSVAHEHGPRPLRVVDIGGASTELVAGEGTTIGDLRSHAIGSVRLTERCVASDPPTAEAIGAIHAEAMAALAAQPLAPHPELHGLAGTVTTAAALLQGLKVYDRDRIDGTRWSRADVRALRDRLAAVALAERIQDGVLPAGRADVIVAGLTILLAVLEHCGAETLVTRDRGLRYALI